MAGYMDLFQDVCNCFVMKFVFSFFSDIICQYLLHCRQISSLCYCKSSVSLSSQLQNALLLFSSTPLQLFDTWWIICNRT